MGDLIDLLGGNGENGGIQDRISEHFRRCEFACNCECGFDTVDTRLVELLEDVRVYFGAPVTINSGCRCEEYNRSVGGAASSQHLVARAADIVVSGISTGLVADLLEDLGAPGVGRYDTFTHVDTRSGGPARWDMRSG